MAKSGPRTIARSSKHEVRGTLIASTIAVADAEGFAHTSARNVAKHAGVAPGLIYYHFDSMDRLLADALEALTDQRLERLRDRLSDPEIPHWVDRLTSAVASEISGAAGSAAVELTIGAKTSPLLAASAAANTDRCVDLVADFARTALQDSPVAPFVPVEAIAEVAVAAFLGVEVFAQLGRDIDIGSLLRPLSALLDQER